MRPLDEVFIKSAGLQPSDKPPSEPQQPPPTLSSFTPEAVGSTIAGPIGGVAAGQLKRLFKPTTDEQIRQETLTELLDPEHEAELTKIRTQAMLSEFMSVDPVISTYDPDEVTGAYNQVVQMAPRAAQQPAIMRGLLRRFLQQQDALEPHEAGQIVDVETALKKLEAPTQLPLVPKVE